MTLKNGFLSVCDLFHPPVVGGSKQAMFAFPLKIFLIQCEKRLVRLTYQNAEKRVTSKRIAYFKLA